MSRPTTPRHTEFADGQWARTKGYEKFCPIGPIIKTEFDTEDQLIETFVDGMPRRRGIPSEMLHSIPELIAFISDNGGSNRRNRLAQ